MENMKGHIMSVPNTIWESGTKVITPFGIGMISRVIGLVQSDATIVYTDCICFMQMPLEVHSFPILDVKTLLVAYCNDGKNQLNFPLKPSDWERAVSKGLVDSGNHINIKLPKSRSKYASIIFDEEVIYTETQLKMAIKMARELCKKLYSDGYDEYSHSEDQILDILRKSVNAPHEKD